MKLSERMADIVTSALGSWTFLIIQSSFIAAWMLANVLLIVFEKSWDPYPFILLNLCLSTQAAYAAPIIMMSQNRLARQDRHMAAQDYELTRRFEELNRDLQQKAYLQSLELESTLERLEILMRELRDSSP